MACEALSNNRKQIYRWRKLTPLLCTHSRCPRKRHKTGPSSCFLPKPSEFLPPFGHPLQQLMWSSVNGSRKPQTMLRKYTCQKVVGV
jgi:hypothetical protein